MVWAKGKKYKVKDFKRRLSPKKKAKFMSWKLCAKFVRLFQFMFGLIFVYNDIDTSKLSII